MIEEGRKEGLKKRGGGGEGKKQGAEEGEWAMDERGEEGRYKGLGEKEESGGEKEREG